MYGGRFFKPLTSFSTAKTLCDERNERAVYTLWTYQVCSVHEVYASSQHLNLNLTISSGVQATRDPHEESLPAAIAVVGV